LTYARTLSRAAPHSRNGSSTYCSC